jgi:predicted enzyme related to lactoylglutathione lyase
VAGITVSGVTIDSAEPEKLAAWWAEALGWQLDGSSCRAPGGGLQRLEFMAVPETKRVKNRVHIDFGADDVQAAVDRLVAMGATIAWEEDFPPELGYRNLVLRDPEGNEFCVGGPST